MKKLFSKKFAAASISILVAGTGIIMACAGDWEPEYGNSNFTPEAFVDSAYKPFFYAPDVYYYNIWHDTEHDVRFNGQNNDDWFDYFGKGIPRSALNYLLLKATAACIDSSLAYIQGKQSMLPATVESIQLLKNTKKAQPFFAYLALAKKCEAFATNNLEYEWNYESKKNKDVKINTVEISNGLQQGFTKTKDNFLKERYWFQLVRFYYFNDPLQSAIGLFEQNEKLFTKNDMYYRTMAYAAGAYYTQKNYSKANYYYSKVFDGCETLKTVAHFSFHPQEENDWKATLALCANNDEKATCWQMLGIFYSDEKRAIQEIYTLNPRSEKLNLLLTRAINIQEQKFSTWDDGLRANRLQMTGDTINSTLVALVNRIAQAGNTSKPYLWQMAAGYLTMLSGNTAKANEWYAMAEQHVPDEKLIRWQLRLLKLINKVAATPRVDSKFENDIVSDMDWLSSMDNNAGAFRYSGAFNWIKRTLSTRYANQQEIIKSVCFNNYPGFYLTNANVEAMKSFLAKTNKSPWEQVCAKLYIMKADDLVEYQAVRLAFDDQLDAAIAKMQLLPTVSGLPANPFNGRLQDCHDCDHDAVQKIKYTKLSLLQKMKDMKDKINTGSEVYSNAVLLGNAFYNITHYGNDRAFYECNVLGSWQYSPFTIDSVFRDLLTNMKVATKYYTLALNAAKTDEQKAKCYFMLAKCERNQWYNETYYSSNSNEYGKDPDFKPWEGFKSLKLYANTQFYKEAINECGYFKTFVSK